VLNSKCNHSSRTTQPHCHPRTAAVLHLTTHCNLSNAAPYNTSLRQIQVHEAANWLLLSLGPVDSIDFSTSFAEIRLVAEMFFRESSSCICKACSRATEQSGITDNRQAQPVLQRGKILRVLQLWNQVDRLCTQDWMGLEGCNIRRNLSKLVNEGRLGINTVTPRINDSDQAWRAWSHGCGDTSRTIKFLTAWAAFKNILVVCDTILCPRNNTKFSCTLSETRKTDLDTALLS